MTSFVVVTAQFSGKNKLMYRWQIKTLQLPLRFTWKISRGASTEKTLYFIEVDDGDHKAMGEVAGITADPLGGKALLQHFHDFQKMELTTLEEIFTLKLPTHLEFGITSALSHLQALQQGKSLSHLLNLNGPSSIPTSFSLPILATDEIEPFFNEYNLSRFPALKLKISLEHPVENCKKLCQLYKGPIRLDANEAFASADDFMPFLDKISDLPIEFVEEPFKRGSKEEYIKLKKQSPFAVFADESVQRELLTEDIQQQFDGINVKLMKAGSYQRALQQIQQAKQWNMKVMLGCMVESSLGIAGALAIGESVDYFDLDGFLYFQHEPHHLVKEEKGQLSLTNPSFPMNSK